LGDEDSVKIPPPFEGRGQRGGSISCSFAGFGSYRSQLVKYLSDIRDYE
jgi:hypothetical protein